MHSSIASVRAALCVASVLMLLGVPAHAQGTALVPSADEAYADVDRLHELGVLDSVIVGQRPYSERQFARLVAVAWWRESYARNYQVPLERAQVLALIQRLDARFGERAVANRRAVDLLDKVSVTATSTDALRRPLLGANAAQTEATIDPLADRRLGAPAARGHTLALEVAQRIEPTGWLALGARERIEVRAPRDSSLRRGSASLLLGGLRARYRNVAFAAGRERFTWSQRAGDGLFLASDAPALDQVSIASDEPFLMPGILRHLGATAGTLLLADLGESVVRSHSKLVLYKVSVAPAENLELGATFENHFGGAGARPASTLNRVIDFLPFIDIFRKHNYNDTTRTLDVESDKAIGAGARLAIPALGGLVVSGEWLVDDFDAHRLLALLTNDASHSIALTFPRVMSPSLGLELSAKHMGIYTYNHATLTNGMTTRGRLLGDELGPDAKAFGATVRWRVNPTTTLTFDGRTALYSDVTYYSGYVDSTQTIWVVGKSSSLPNEQLDRVLVSASVQPSAWLDFWARAGGERIRNARFFGNRVNYVLETGFRAH